MCFLEREDTSANRTDCMECFINACAASVDDTVNILTVDAEGVEVIVGYDGSRVSPWGVGWNNFIVGGICAYSICVMCVMCCIVIVLIRIIVVLSSIVIVLIMCGSVLVICVIVLIVIVIVLASCVIVLGIIIVLIMIGGVCIVRVSCCSVGIIMSVIIVIIIIIIICIMGIRDGAVLCRWMHRSGGCWFFRGYSRHPRVGFFYYRGGEYRYVQVAGVL